MDENKTAVDFLYDQICLPEYGTPPEWVADAYIKAKQIEKEQIVEFWNLGYQHGAHDSGRSGETHYEFKYGKND